MDPENHWLVEENTLAGSHCQVYVSSRECIYMAFWFLRLRHRGLHRHPCSQAAVEAGGLPSVSRRVVRFGGLWRGTRKGMEREQR